MTQKQNSELLNIMKIDNTKNTELIYMINMKPILSVIRFPISFLLTSSNKFD